MTTGLECGGGHAAIYRNALATDRSSLETKQWFTAKLALWYTPFQYEEKLVDQIYVNDKRFWNYSRHFTKSSSAIGNINFEGRNFSDDQTKAY